MARAITILLIAVATVAATLGGPVGAQVDPEPTAIVSLGDSYISGEAARWVGNSYEQIGDRNGTDRAHRGPLDYDVDSIYVDGTNDSGCHRADFAPIKRAYVPVTNRINLACSGADTVHVVSEANGGRWHRGEPPQADQLVAVARDNAVELVVVSIGGNDLGFGGIVLDCTVAYTSSFLWWKNRCADDKQGEVDAAMEAAMNGVVAALGDVRSVLDDHGDRDARIVLMSYPSPVPSGDRLRYDTNFERVFVGGCPFWSSDATWARRSLVPQIAAALRGAAGEAGVEFLDVQDLFEGREICADTARQSDGTPSDREDEWARLVTTGLLQGEAQESLHPNYFGQRAIGRCIELVSAAEPDGEWTCTNRPGAGARTLDLIPI